eukprot:135302-Amphidinium_carterae.1
MDDPAIVLTGSWEEVVVHADVLILLWLSLGVPLSWKKGLLSADAHMWIGVVFDPRPSVGDVVMSVPCSFLLLIKEDAEQLAHLSGVAKVSVARRLVGRASRLAQ